MYLRYGSYVHADSEVLIAIDKETLRDERDNPYAIRERWHISGELQAASQSALTTAIAALITGYSREGLDAGFFDNNGAATAHGLISARTIGGVKIVKPPFFPKGDGAEYSTFRRYEIVLEADFPSVNEVITAWMETITLGGGGRREKWLNCLNGPPIKQLVNASVTYHASQQGQAVGFFGYLTPPLPLWPNDEHLEQRQIERSSPKRRGAALINYPVSWRYVFEAANPFLGLPTAR